MAVLAESPRRLASGTAVNFPCRAIYFAMPTTSAPLRVLIVEDELLIREFIKEELEAAGDVVIEARHLCMMMRGVEKQHSGAITSVKSAAFACSTNCEGSSSSVTRTRPCAPTASARYPPRHGRKRCPMQIEIWSDVVCPWCYIGKRRLERALGEFEHADEVEVSWRRRPRRSCTRCVPPTPPRRLPPVKLLKCQCS